MRAEYVRLIAELDLVLALVRAIWISAADNAQRQDAMSRINSLLDERLRLMALRNSATS